MRPPLYPVAAGALLALRWPRVGVLVTVLLLGGWWAAQRLATLAADPLAPRIGERVDTVATIEEPWRGGTFSARADVELAGGGRVLLRIPTSSPARRAAAACR